MTIKKVIQKPSGWWVITDSTGAEHATKKVWMASLAQRYQEKETDVEILSFRGWFYHELYKIDAVPPQEQAS